MDDSLHHFETTGNHKKKTKNTGESSFQGFLGGANGFCSFIVSGQHSHHWPKVFCRSRRPGRTPSSRTAIPSWASSRRKRPYRCPFCLFWSKNRWPWFTWWFNHLPISPKRTPMDVRSILGKAYCQWFAVRNLSRQTNPEDRANQGVVPRLVRNELLWMDEIRLGTTQETPK